MYAVYIVAICMSLTAIWIVHYEETRRYGAQSHLCTPLIGPLCVLRMHLTYPAHVPCVVCTTSTDPLTRTPLKYSDLKAYHALGGLIELWLRGKTHPLLTMLESGW